MNAKELAEKMLEYGDAQLMANELRAEIEEAVLGLESTQTVGNVKATYRKPRKTYQYKSAAKNHPMVSEATINLFTTQPPAKIDWRKICDHAGIYAEYTESEPGVTVKLI